MDPFSVMGAGVSTSMKILDISFQLKAVGEQTADLIATTKHVNSNVTEARRLYRTKGQSVSAEDRGWMDNQISDCEAALREVQRILEPARVDTQTVNSVSNKNRVLWLFRDGPNVRDKLSRLQACHQTLNNIISILHARDVVVIAPVIVEPAPGDQSLGDPPAYDENLEAVLDWRKIRRNTKSATNLRQDSNHSYAPSTAHAPKMTHARSMSSMSDPSLPMPKSPGLSYLDAALGHRPPLTTSFSEGMTAQAVPSWMYEGFDSLQVAELKVPDASPVTLSVTGTSKLTGEKNLRAVDSTNSWTTDTIHPFSTGPYSNQTQPQSSFHDHRYAIVENQAAPELPARPNPPYSYTTSASQFPPASGDKHVAAAGRAGGGPTPSYHALGATRGRQWLAQYASRSDVSVRYGDLQQR